MQPEPGIGLTGPEKTQLQCSRVQKAICWDPQGEAHPVVQGARCCGCRNAWCPQKSWFQGAALLVRPPNANEATGHSSRTGVAAQRGNVGPELGGNVVPLSRQPLARHEGKGASKEHSRRKSRRLHQARRHESCLECQGTHINCSRSRKLRRGRAPAGRDLGGPPPPKLEPNGHHSPQRFNGLITTSPQPDRAAGTRLANRLNVHPPHTTGTAVGTLQGHGPPPCPLVWPG